MQQRFSVLVVCLGNVCRSPLAERLLQRRFEDTAAGAGLSVSSAGVRALVGSPMHDLSAAELRRLGGDPDGFVSRQVTGPMAESADLVLTATRELRSRLLEEAPRALKRTFTLREFAALVGSGVLRESPLQGAPDLVARAASWRGSATLDDYDVPDPIGRSEDVHREVADMLDADCAVIAQALLDAVSAPTSR